MKHEVNIGTLYRSAHAFGASFIYTVGRRYRKQAGDTHSTGKHIPLYHFRDLDDLKEHLPFSCPLIGVETDDSAIDIRRFKHPERACYLLGAEDHGLSDEMRKTCHQIVEIPGSICLNVSTAGSIVMYDRLYKQQFTFEDIDA